MKTWSISTTLLLIALWSGGSARAQEPLQVLATVPTVGHLAEMVGGDLVEVDLLIPPGASPHLWQPSAADMRRLAEADLAVFVGAGMEPWAHRLTEATESPRVDLFLVEELPQERLLRFDDPHDHDGHDHAPGAIDPHIWLSPEYARIIAARLADEFIRLRPAGQERWSTQRDAALAEIDSFYDEAQERRLAWGQHPSVITMHSGWGYLADDLRIDIASVVIETPGVEISPTAMRRLIADAREQDIRAVIAEPQMSPAPARQVAEALGVPLLVLDPLGSHAESWRAQMDGLLVALDSVMTRAPVVASAATSPYPFLIPSFVIGALVAVLCGVLSIYVVLRRMAFIGQGIGHAAFGGVALGLWLFPAAVGPLDWPVFTVAVVFCLVNAIAIGIISRRTDLSEDTAIGILFVLSMALGAIFFTLRQERVADLFSYLFGSIVAVTWGDAKMVGALALGVLFLVWLLWKELEFLTFDEEAAKVAGLPVEMLNHLLLALLSLTVVIAIKIVGIILVNAALVLPGATARLLTQSLGRMCAVAVGIALVTTLGGLAVANVVDVPAGAAVVLVQSGTFGVVWLVRR